MSDTKFNEIYINTNSPPKWKLKLGSWIVFLSNRSDSTGFLEIQGHKREKLLKPTTLINFSFFLRNFSIEIHFSYNFLKK